MTRRYFTIIIIVVYIGWSNYSIVDTPISWTHLYRGHTYIVDTPILRNYQNLAGKQSFIIIIKLCLCFALVKLLAVDMAGL